MKLIGTVLDPEDLRKYFQKMNIENNGLVRRRKSKSKLPLVTLVDPIRQATNQAKQKIKRGIGKRKGAGQAIRRTIKQTIRKTVKKTKAVKRSRTSQLKSRRPKDNFSR